MRRALLPLSLLLALASPAWSQSWSNYGGGPLRNGLTSEIGPKSADGLWTNSQDYSLISWHPFVWIDPATGQGIVVTVRESAFPTSANANDAVVAYDLDTGLELWRTTLPFAGSTVDWIAWIAGVSPNGVLWASRSDNARQRPLQRYDVRTGTPLGATPAITFAWAHDGAVFGPDGDIVVGDRNRLVRIDENTGQTVWDIPRTCSISGHCGPALDGDALYIDEVAPGGQVITRLDYATGQKLYSSSVMPGVTSQNAPFVAPGGGRVYFSRTQNNVAVDFLFAFDDTGSGLVEAWSVPVRWTTSHEQGVGLDGSIYTFLPGGELARLAPTNGAVLASTAPLFSTTGTVNYSPKTAVDAAGKVYVSNGWASNPATGGRLWGFDRDLNPLFTVNLDRPNSGGPALARDGTVVACDRPGVYAWRSIATVAGFFFENGNGQNPTDYSTFDAPELGSVWQSQVTLAPGAVLSVVAVAPGPAVAIPYVCPTACELLVNPASVLVYDVSTGSHALAIPANPALAGIELIAQGARVDFPLGGVPELVLMNAFRLRLGA